MVEKPMSENDIERFVRDACKTYAPTKPIFISEQVISSELSVFWHDDDIKNFSAMETANPNFLI